jgi:hypothetical protein
MVSQEINNMLSSKQHRTLIEDAYNAITDKQFITEAGARFERQETALVDMINKYYKKNKNKSIVVVDASGVRLTGITGAKKFDERVSTGKEPYTDVQLLRARGKPINLSNKGTSAPSVAGGGLAGLELIIPGFGKDLFVACKKWFKRNGYKDGDAGTDLYAKVGDDKKEDIIIGTKMMGGPIDYMYIGPMKVEGTWDAKKKELKVNGNLTDSATFADSFDFYFRIRKRRIYQTIDLKTTDSGGRPSLFMVPPDIADSKGKYNMKKYKGFFGKPKSGVDPGLKAWKASGGKRDPNRRIVIAKKPPRNANIVEF